jgi:hypothetical protein
MGTVFQSICAEISSEFETLLSDNSAMNFLERVCDMTGTLMISKYSKKAMKGLIVSKDIGICIGLVCYVMLWYNEYFHQ